MASRCGSVGHDRNDDGDYVNNHITTSRYKAWNLVFLNLREQFRFKVLVQVFGLFGVTVTSQSTECRIHATGEIFFQTRDIGGAADLAFLQRSSGWGAFRPSLSGPRPQARPASSGS